MQPGDDALSAAEPQVVTLSGDALTAARLAVYTDTPDGFELFYWFVTDSELPPLARQWVEDIYTYRRNGLGAVIKAFRGSTKTTTISLFLAYRIGLEPNKSHLLVQVGDDSAQKNTRRVADIIATNPAWKAFFGYIVPDPEVAWGANGYEVKDTRLEYGEWRRRRTKDPTLVGRGYASSALIGSHPTGTLLVDDIHDENNTRSQRELSAVIDTLRGTILPTMTAETWPIFIGTPWVEGDALDYIEQTGQFGLCRTPVYALADEHTPGAVFVAQMGPDVKDQWLKLAWPERFGVEEIAKQRALAGKIEFARMFLLDLSAGGNTVFKWYPFPAGQGEYLNWPMVFGVDYAGTLNPSQGNDFFAMAYVAKVPGGGAVVFGGVHGLFTQAISEQHVLSAHETYQPLQMVVEGDGKGEEFIQVMLRHNHLRLAPMKTGGKGKHQRLVRQMGPWLESGRVRILDRDDPFLNELRKELDAYPNAAHDDCLDALYWALRGCPDVLAMPASEYEMPKRGVKVRAPNPFNAFAEQRV